MRLVEMGYSTDDTCLPYRLISFIVKQHCKQIIIYTFYHINLNSLKGRNGKHATNQNYFLYKRPSYGCDFILNGRII